MPKGPRGEKRPGDVIGAAIMVAKIATGEVEDNATPAERVSEVRAAAGRRGAKARVEKTSHSERTEIASKAARTRWAQREPKSVKP